MKTKILSKLYLLVFFFLSSFSSPSFANTTQTNFTNNDSDGWHFLIAPYGWLSSISADISVKDITEHIFIPTSKIFKNLDFVGELHLEASRGPWTFMLDPTYLKLSVDTTAGPIYVGPLNRIVIGPVDASVGSQTLLIDGGVFYRVYQVQTAPSQLFSFEVLGGARYLGLKNTISLGLSQAELFPGINVSDSTNVVAPILGGRIKQDFSKAHLWLRGDVGGFGVDDVTDTWSAIAGLTYNVSPHVDLGIAYRVLKINVNKSDTLAFDTLMYGPELGIVFQY